MNKYALHVAGGALLATTALASGTLAATIRYTGATGTGLAQAGGVAAEGSPLVATTSTFGIANNIVGGATGSSVSIGPMTLVIDTATFTATSLTVQLNVTGAELDTTPSSTLATTSIGLFNNESATSLSLTSNTTNGGATGIIGTDRITILSITAITWGAISLSGLKFRNAQALATIGTSIQASANISGGGLSTIDSAPATNVLTSRLGSAVEVSAGGTITVSNTSTPQFATVTQGGATSNSAVLSTVKFTDSSGLALNLTATHSANTLVSTYEVRLTHGVLTDTAALSSSLGVQLYSATSVSVTRTSAQFASNVATFNVAAAPVVSAGVLINTVVVNFSGTASIAAQAAGSTTATPTNQTANTGGTAAVTGTATALTRGGMNTTINFVQPSVNSFASFIRVTNTGSTAGSVTMVVRDSSTGTALGTYTSASIASGGTIQVSTATLESQAVPAITPVSGVPYDLGVTGSITGYVQHIGFNGANGALSDLSAFRQGGSGSNP